MIEDHAQLSKTLLTVAMRVTGESARALLPKLDATQMRMMKQLLDTSGADREQLYLQQQLLVHEDGLALNMNYARNGRNPALVQFAEQAIPAIALHLKLIRGILAQEQHLQPEEQAQDSDSQYQGDLFRTQVRTHSAAPTSCCYS